MKSKILFDKNKTDQVCFYERVNFLNPKMIENLESDLKDFINNKLNKNKIILSDNGTRLNIQHGDPNYKKLWHNELEGMRKGMLQLRKELSESLKKATKSDRFDFVANHRGMFSRLGLSEQNVEVLRKEFGVYMVSDSRINIAGLQPEKIDFLATAVSEVL